MDLGVALDQIRQFASRVLEKFRDAPRGPDSVELEFGLKLNAAAGVIIAHTEAEAHLTVKLAWTRPSREQDSADT